MLSHLISQKINGEPYLQSKILLYVLGSPSAIIMGPLIKSITEEKEKHPEKNPDEMTAWRYTSNLRILEKNADRFPDSLRPLSSYELYLCKLDSEWENVDTITKKFAKNTLDIKKAERLNDFLDEFNFRHAATHSSRAILEQFDLFIEWSNTAQAEPPSWVSSINKRIWVNSALLYALKFKFKKNNDKIILLNP